MSAEIFTSWTSSFDYMIKQTEASQLETLLDKLFTNPFELKVTPNIQGRYLTIYRSFFANQSYQLRDHALKLFDFIRGMDLKDVRQAKEIANLLNIINKSVFLAPIDKERLVQLNYVKDADKLEELEIKDSKLVKSGRYYYEVNSQAVKLIEDLVGRANGDDKEHFYLAITLAIGVKGARLRNIWYSYLKPAIHFLIEFNVNFLRHFFSLSIYWKNSPKPKKN